MTTEKNPLVSSGEFTRVFVAEILPGEIDAFNRVVVSVQRVADLKVRIEFANREYTSPFATSNVGYFNVGGTLLIRTDSLRDES